MVVTVVGEDLAAKKTTTCSNCAAKLEYTLADTRVESVRDYTGGSDNYRRLNCPRCGHELTVTMY